MADEEDIARLDAKGLIAMFGTSTIPRNIDEPSDGVLYVIKDKKGNILYIKNPAPKGKWCKFAVPNGTAQRLYDASQNGTPVVRDRSVQDTKQKRKRSSSPTLLPEAIPSGSGKKKRGRSPSPVPEPSSLPKELEKMVEKIVEEKIQQKDKKQKDEKEKQKDEEESEECFACSQSQHTGATLDFDNMMV